MLTALNHLMEAVEDCTAEEVDVATVAKAHGTTEHHLRRMFSSLAGMPLSEYVRRRRMTLAAARLVESTDDLLTVAVAHGYGSTRRSDARSAPCTGSDRLKHAGAAGPSAANSHSGSA